jgi:hypothetical protein
MSLIDITYLDQVDVNLPIPSSDDRSDFILRYEPEFLKKVFGYTLYKLIAAYGEASEQRIKDIVEGKEFEEDIYTYKWNGLKNTDKISPIAYYVYYMYMEKHASHTTTQGEKVIKNENSESVSPINKMINAWQNMVQLVGNVNDYRIDSLYYFMSRNIDTYTEWQFEGFENINLFGI